MSQPRAVRTAATVVIMRLHGEGFRVFVQRRPQSMVFAGGMYVFPGGASEPTDGDAYETAIRETLEETGVLLDRRELYPWARWITPAGEVRRFDATFFVAELPDGQEPEPIGTEMDAVEWLTPAAALRRFAAGELDLMLPTETILRELAEFAAVADVIAATVTRSLEPIRP